MYKRMPDLALPPPHCRRWIGHDIIAPTAPSTSLLTELHHSLHSDFHLDDMERRQTRFVLRTLALVSDEESA